ncbi:MAG TPA: RICIN domain-containing protein [Blastocatellia bacterium]|nr:RICIN domain-containing protein [Blastocatellia bacterium]
MKVATLHRVGLLLATALLLGLPVAAQDRSRDVENRRVGAETQNPLRDFRELSTTARGRGVLTEPNIPESWITRVTLNLRRTGEAEIEAEGEVLPVRIRGRWTTGEGENINLTLAQYGSVPVSGSGRVVLKNGVFTRLEINTVTEGRPVTLNFDARTAPNSTVAGVPRDPLAGRFVIEAVASGLVLDLRMEDKRTLQQWSNSSAANQRWETENLGNGFYAIKSLENSQVLTADDRPRDGIFVFTAPLDRSRESQQWQLKDAGNGQVYLLTRRGRALEFTSGIRSTGSRPQLTSPGDRETQKFKLLPVAGTPQVIPVTPPGLPEGPGSMTWRGMVDGTLRVEVRGATITEKATEGSPYTNSNYQFTASLPRRAAFVSVSRRRGRGSVEVIEQPSEYNNFTAVVQIRDRQGGSDNYEFVLRWQ